MNATCCSQNGEVMLLACSGGSNVGQLTNQAAVELTREGFGKMYCLAGVGAKLKGFVKATGEAPEILVLDGCPVGCAKAIMENAGLPMGAYMVVTELGIDKVKDRALALSTEDLETVKQAARSMKDASAVKRTCGCACGGAE
ncbi:MAG: putative zinc-binding protein [Desulfovibrio sp.]|nr:putative zinc-binding protein [Desulfovibrio sp.]MBI4957909.1 putative zinc-binding protein [Desulfovibrio sp.]